MTCPSCGLYAPVVEDTIPGGAGAPRYLQHITRERSCTHCGERWTTVEVDAEALALLMERAGEVG